MKHRSILKSCAILLSIAMLAACGRDNTAKQKVSRVDSTNAFYEQVNALPTYTSTWEGEKSSYMIYYGELNDEIIDAAMQYEVVILHPKMGNITRDQVQRIRASGTIVLGYIAVGEDLRTANMTPEEMKNDPRFIGDGSGPRVDPRKSGTTSLDGVNIEGDPSPSGTGYASYYLDDNNHDGKPDINPIFNCAFTNIGDPAWFDVLEQMTIDGNEKIPGIREILSDDYGRSLGCDGLFLDTIDTCAPNAYTDDNSPNKTKFEWTAPGVAEFMKTLKTKYPDKLILQNRGIFFYNPQLAHYKYNPRTYVDYVMFESYMLDSNTTTLYYEGYAADNRYNYGPRLVAEASRPDGFQVLSLGYAEGPEEYHLKETLLGDSTAGLEILTEDMNVAQEEAGFMHYITDGGVVLVNDFVIKHENKDDTTVPTWSSTYNKSTSWPPLAPEPRVGIQQVQAIEKGVIVRWDVAMDKNPVTYVLYYQKQPFDFEKDPDLKNATSVELIPEVGDGYVNGVGPNVYPFQATLDGLESKQTYYFVIRARDNSENHNEEKNTVTLKATVK
ncbi:MAG: hypothetical protein J6Z22_03875 [Lachnospiraceae bacterium]|nr:hypothetical protein [Lachnospiraceae bacterium]